MTKVSVAVPVYNVENYIYDMLESVRGQTFKDFEVVIVDDGSTDSSPDIAKQFCTEDERFKYFRKENGGVASARNMAIDLACGEYIVFYDPDDYVPATVLEKMYRAAANSKADMVVGVMEEKSLGESLIYMHSQKLAKQKKISPADDHFIGAWSMCHKMFSLEFIKKNDIRFKKLFNAEDGVFTYTALNCAEKICGCDTIAYNYIKRPFWLTPSATQTVSSKYLYSLLSSHDEIKAQAEKLTEKYLSKKEQEVYMSKLYYRFIDGEMINGYYRNIWRAEEDLRPVLEKRTAEYRTHMTEEQWKSILKKNKDLKLENGFESCEDMAKNPDVSIIISGKLDDKKLELVLGSIYNQAFTRFEVLIGEKEAKMMPEIYKNKVNLRIIKGDDDYLKVATDKSSGKYILIFDRFAMFTKNSLKLMAAKLESKPELGFVSMLMKSFDGKQYESIPVLSAAFGYGKKGRSSVDKLALCDNIFSNKLFRKNALESFKFTEDSREDMEKLYRNLKCERLRKGMMITDMKEKDFLVGMKCPPPQRTINFRHAKNSFKDRAINRLKRHITREDIEKFKSKIGK